MHRFAHIALLPAVFLMVSEAGPTPELDRVTIIDAQNVEIRPVSEALRRANPRVVTEVRSGVGKLYGITAPQSLVIEKLATPPAGINVTIDLRTPPAPPSPIEVR